MVFRTQRRQHSTRKRSKRMNISLPGTTRRIYYGWIMLVTVSITEVVSWGILYYAFSVFITPMESELGWPRSAISGAFSLALLCGGLAALPVGRWIDRHGTRMLMTSGSVLGTLLLLAWSQVTSLWAF